MSRIRHALAGVAVAAAVAVLPAAAPLHTDRAVAQPVLADLTSVPVAALAPAAAPSPAGGGGGYLLKAPQYLFIAGSTFTPVISGVEWSTTNYADMIATTGNLLANARLDLPLGAMVTQLVWYVQDQDGTYDAGFAITRAAGASAQNTLLSSASSTASGTAVQSVIDDTSGVAMVANNTDALLLRAWLTTKMKFYGVRVAYVVPTPEFHAMAPVRVYDSRLPGYMGLLAPRSSRVVSVANSIDAWGNIAQYSVVPLGTTAITYNLTVTGTTGSGVSWLALVPGGVTTYGVSAINWTGPGQTVANGGTVTIDAVTREVRVFCDGAGGTQFIVDVTGYYQ